MRRYQHPSSLAERIAWRIVFTAMVLSGSVLLGVAAVGVIWLAAQLPAPHSADQVMCPAPSPAHRP